MCCMSYFLCNLVSLRKQIKNLTSKEWIWHLVIIASRLNLFIYFITQIFITIALLIVFQKYHNIGTSNIKYFMKQEPVTFNSVHFKANVQNNSRLDTSELKVQIILVILCIFPRNWNWSWSFAVCVLVDLTRRFYHVNRCGTKLRSLTPKCAHQYLTGPFSQWYISHIKVLGLITW